MKQNTFVFVNKTKLITQMPDRLKVSRRLSTNRKSSFFEIPSPLKPMNLIQRTNQQLQQYLLGINDEITKIIQKRESSHLLAFKAYNKKTEEELKKLRERIFNNEANLSGEEVISRLQKQTAIFRQEAMKYFYLVQDKDEELRVLRRELQVCKSELEFNKWKMKETIKKAKLEKTKLLLQTQKSEQFVDKFDKSVCPNSTRHSSTSKFRKTFMDYQTQSQQSFRQVFKTSPKQTKLVEEKHKCGSELGYYLNESEQRLNQIKGFEDFSQQQMTQLQNFLKGTIYRKSIYAKSKIDETFSRIRALQGHNQKQISETESKAILFLSDENNVSYLINLLFFDRVQNQPRVVQKGSAQSKRNHKRFCHSDSPTKTQNKVFSSKKLREQTRLFDLHLGANLEPVDTKRSQRELQEFTKEGSFNLNYKIKTEDSVLDKTAAVSTYRHYRNSQKKYGKWIYKERKELMTHRN